MFRTRNPSGTKLVNFLIFFNSLDLYSDLPESGDLWYKSAKQQTICSPNLSEWLLPMPGKVGAGVLALNASQVQVYLAHKTPPR